MNSYLSDFSSKRKRNEKIPQNEMKVNRIEEVINCEREEKKIEKA